jgi:hypothetical protein
MVPDEKVGQCVETALVRLPLKYRTLAETPHINDGNSKLQEHSPTSDKNRQPPDEGQRRNDEVAFWRTICEIAGIRSPAPRALYIVQLRQSFIYTYLTADVIESNRPFLHVFYWMAPFNLGLHASRDALCLVHLGMRCMCVLR